MPHFVASGVHGLLLTLVAVAVGVVEHVPARRIDNLKVRLKDIETHMPDIMPPPPAGHQH